MRLRAEECVVERARRGDEGAFRRIVAEHHGLIYSVAHGIMRNRDDAEEIVQNVFMRIYAGLPEFRGASKLSTWIYRIARNEALNALARRRQDHVPLDDCADVRSPAPSPEAALERDDEAAALERAMGRLEEAQRLALELRYRADKSYEEIADIMELPLGTVKTNIHRGKAELRRLLARGASRVPPKG